jgi:hypothetical protein
VRGGQYCEAGEHCIIRSFIILTRLQIFLHDEMKKNEMDGTWR